MGRKRAFLQEFQQEILLDDQQHKIVQPPHDEVPVGTVPDAGGGPDEEHVKHLPRGALAVAAQRNVDVIPEPAGQGNVPSPPELRNAGRNIRQIKVGGTVKAHQGSEAVAHLAVPGKVKVQLQRVGNDAQPGQRGGNIA